MSDHTIMMPRVLLACRRRVYAAQDRWRAGMRTSRALLIVASLILLAVPPLRQAFQPSESYPIRRGRGCSSRCNCTGTALGGRHLPVGGDSGKRAVSLSLGSTRTTGSSDCQPGFGRRSLEIGTSPVPSPGGFVFE